MVGPYFLDSLGAGEGDSVRPSSYVRLCCSSTEGLEWWNITKQTVYLVY